MQVRLKHWPWIQSFAKGQSVWGWKTNCGTEACTGLRKGQEFSKASTSITQESEHFNISYSRAFLRQQHSFSSAHSRDHAPANPAVTAPSRPSLCWPAEAARAAGTAPGTGAHRGSGAVQSQLGFPGTQRCQGPEHRAFGWLCADTSGPGSHASNNPATHHNPGLSHCTAQNRSALQPIIK